MVAPVAEVIEIVLDDGVRVRVPLDFSEVSLRRVLSALGHER
mgnify:CR=1 FL=1